MRTQHKCIFCGFENSGIEISDRFVFKCSCTTHHTHQSSYTISRELFDDLSEMKQTFNHHLVSAVIKELSLDRNEIVITSENYEHFLYSSLIPNGLKDKEDKLIRYLYKTSTYFGEKIGLYLHSDKQFDYNITYSKDVDEIKNLLQSLDQEGIVDGDYASGGDGRVYYNLTSMGYKYAESLITKNENSKKCFIAMSFDDELLNQIANHVIPHIRETGFNPVLVKDVAHNDDVVDRIIYEIKTSRFVIADFTQLKGGVYYEAGLAKGFGLEVIHSVRQDFIDQLHFDTRNTNHIVWENSEDLGVKLRDRILATIPGALLTK